MAVRPCHAGSAAYCLALAAALGSTAGCDKRSSVPALPQIMRPPPPSAARAPGDGVNYRRTGGGELAPINIGDDPVPTEAPSAAAKQPAGGNVTLNGDPNGITRETLNRSIQSAMGSLAACFTNLTHDPMVAVSFEADPSGRPSLVRINGAPPDAEHCIRNVVQGIRFPSFQGKGVQVDLPLSFHRARTPAQQQPTGEQQAEGAPPLFLEP